MKNDPNRPYSVFKKSWTYLSFLIKSKNRHGIHSPFVFDYVENVLNKRYIDKEIELERKKLKKNSSSILFKDFGQRNDRQLKISDLAKNSLKKAKEAALIAQTAAHYNIKDIIELGTSLGLTTAYISKLNPNARLRTVEANEIVLSIARSTWNTLKLSAIESYHSTFDDILQELVADTKDPCLFFIDGNHRYEATMHYFNQLLLNRNELMVIIFDDIHWSRAMEEAWKEIIVNEKVSLSIDLFELGIVFFNSRFQKEHFVIRY